jgi:hypothetical protein
MSFSINMNNLYLLVNYDDKIIKIYFKDQNKKDIGFKFIKDYNIK